MGLERDLERVQYLQKQKELQEITLDKMTPEIWNSMNKAEKRRWRKHILKQGETYTQCHVCYFPTIQGVYGCESCKYRKEKGIPLSPVY